MKQIQYRPGSGLETAITERTVAGTSPHLTARTMAARYADICRSSIPYFTVGEWRAIAGSEFTKSEMCRHDIGSMWPRAVAFEITTAGLAPRFEIDGAALLAKLEDLAPAQAWAALDVLERYWVKKSAGYNPALPGEARLAQ